MEFEFPKYPFVWDYSDMYNIIEYSSKRIESKNQKESLEHVEPSEPSEPSEPYESFEPHKPFEPDENIDFLLSKFPDSQIVYATQTISSRESAKNLNFHTWYLSQKNVFETTETTIKVITDSKYKFKSNVKCFIFDPMDIFEKESELETKTTMQEKKFSNITIVKKKISVIPELIPLLYIHTHNVKGIFRFSPNNNNKIKIRETINNGICYVVLEKLILKLNIKIK